jgi:hypothetical protein
MINLRDLLILNLTLQVFDADLETMNEFPRGCAVESRK